MKRRILVTLVTAAVTAGLSVSVADDGEKVLKSMSKNINTGLSGIPLSEHVYIDMMRLYVPLQKASGEVITIDYKNADGGNEGTRTAGKPLVAVFQHGPVEFVEDAGGFVGHGKRDAYAAVSLDDGLTWKATNLSESATLVSSDVCRTDLSGVYGACGGTGSGGTGNYPGDVVNIFQATAPSFSGTPGNYTLAVWPSRYCGGGEPNYALDKSDPFRRLAIAVELGIDLANPSPDDLYLVDMYGVAGSQGSVDYAEDKWEQNHAVGVIPYSCLWSARGVLVGGDDPRTSTVEQSYIRWFKAERLTSGARDVNRVEASCVAGVGCAITWQEDPEGLRPGQGEGPGEGWSGAIANSQTDVWYSYIEWDEFTKVQAPADSTQILSLEEYETLAAAGDVTQKPKPAIPFAMPMRLTDNARCNVENPKPYCNGSAIYDATPDPDTGEVALDPLAYGLRDMCAATIEIPTGPQGKPSDICITEDGLPLVGNIAATRPRLSLRGYDKGHNGTLDGAFVIMVAEESKGLGAFGFTEEGETGAPCDPETDEGCIAFDEGKNMWYYSFDMSLTGAFAGTPDGLVEHLAGHGNMLNQPAVNWQTGEFYPLRNTSDFWDFGSYDYDIWKTEIARRGSLLDQDIYKGVASRSGLVALPSWKQGAMNQGGPADVMLRRIVGQFGNGGACPITVDADQPRVVTATYNPAGKRLNITGSGADGDNKTSVLIRNAVTQAMVGTAGDKKDGTFSVNLANVQQVPCAVQAADDAGSAAYGPYVRVANAPASCVGPVPAACNGTAARISSASWNAVNNPYAFRNMECRNWWNRRASPDSAPINPFYPDGVCLDSAINLSSVIPDTCVDSQNPSVFAACPTVDFSQGTSFAKGDTNPVLQGRDVVPNQTKVLSWHQCPFDKAEPTSTTGEGSPVNILDCPTDLYSGQRITLQDQSWYNPLDVAKGHRGFLDGDFVMMLYAWSPNWRLNTKGSDRYELYIRRSFDGGTTWRTLPANYQHHDGSGWSGEGTVTCETFRSNETQASGDLDEPRVCNGYAPGTAEQARNVTQHKSMRITTLDPRYTPTAETIQNWATIGWEPPNYETTLAEYSEDVRDPSRFFIVYETGDNTTTEEGEPEPLDLFAGRAIRFGDHYVVWAEETSEDARSGLDNCYPSNPHDQLDADDERVGSGFCNEFDIMEQGQKGIVSGEASLEANPGGEFLYGVWEQETLNTITGALIEGDAMFRRIWWIDGYIPNDAWTFGQGDGSGTAANR